MSGRFRDESDIVGVVVSAVSKLPQVRAGDTLVFDEHELARLDRLDVEQIKPALEAAAARAGLMVEWWYFSAKRVWCADIKEKGGGRCGT